MKKFIGLALTLILTFSALVACTNISDENTAGAAAGTAAGTETQAYAVPNPTSDFEYAENEDGTIAVSRYIGTDADVVIPQTIDGKNVTKIGMTAFSGNQTICSVVIPDSVVEIAGAAFLNCTKLETVTLSSNLVKIGGCAFEKTAISQVTFPQSLQSIGARAFAECKNLKSVTIIPNLSDLGEVFCGSGLETVIIEEGVETIGISMFASTNIREVILPQSVKTIGMNAFGSCPNLGSVTLNEGLVKIDSYAFAKTAITEIVIPRSVTELTDDVFQGCDKLQKVRFEGNAPAVDYVTGLHDMPSYTIYYHADAAGFTSPEWNGYKTEIYE